VRDADDRRRGRSPVDGVECRENLLINHFFHDFKGNISTVIMCIEAVSDGVWGEVTERQKASLGRAGRTCERMIRLINNFRDMTQMEEGVFESEPETVNVGAVLEGIEREIAPVAHERGQLLDFVREGRLPAATFRGALFERVMKSLFEVVLDATRRGGRVIARSGCDGGGLSVDVAFEAIEADEETLGTVFDRLAQTRTGLQLGRGFTLLFCREAVAWMGGRLHLGPWPGRGCRVTIALPLKPAG